MRLNKSRRFLLLLGILFAVILIGYSVSPIEGFIAKKTTKKSVNKKPRAHTGANVKNTGNKG